MGRILPPYNHFVNPIYFIQTPIQGHSELKFDINDLHDLLGLLDSPALLN